MEDDVDDVVLTPCQCLLLDLVSSEDGEAVFVTKESWVGASGALMKGNGCG